MEWINSHILSADQDAALTRFAGRYRQDFTNLDHNDMKNVEFLMNENKLTGHQNMARDIRSQIQEKFSGGNAYRIENGIKQHNIFGGDYSIMDISKRTANPPLNIVRKLLQKMNIAGTLFVSLCVFALYAFVS